MCGRFTREYTWCQIHDMMNLQWPSAAEEMPPSFNVAPSQMTPVCILQAGQRVLLPMQWGFRPSWVDAESGRGAPPINARAETVATSPLFRSAFRSRRCVIPATGFYEWKPTPGHKQPYYIRLLNDPILLLAGLWEERRDGDRSVFNFGTLTTRPNALMATIHDRMPVILRPESVAAWLAPGEADPALLEPFPAEEMSAHPVSSRVNKPSANDPSLIAPAEPGGLWA